MRVLVLSHMYPSTANEVAGIFVHQQVKALKSKGVEVCVVSPVPWTPFPINRMTSKWRAYNQIPEKSVWDGVEVFYPRYITFPRALFFATSGRRMYHGIRKVIERLHQEFKFELIHAHVALPDGRAALMLTEKFKVPVVVAIHGQDLQQTIYRNNKCKDIVADIIKTSSKTILVSNKLKRIAKEITSIEDKLVVIPNGVEIRDIHVHNKLHESNNTILLSVSNLVKTKGIDINLKAFARLVKKHPQLQYWIIGDGPEREKLQQLANILEVSVSVRFLGRQSHSKVMEYMAMCDIFSLPSWQEGFGVVYLEAMAHGKPVIGCRGEGIEDFVEDGKTGILVEPRNVEDLIRAIDFLLTNPGEAKIIGQRAREVVLNNYTWDNNAEKTIEVYREVLNR